MDAIRSVLFSFSLYSKRLCVGGINKTQETHKKKERKKERERERERERKREREI